jgi:hypothetical protein
MKFIHIEQHYSNGTNQVVGGDDGTEERRINIKQVIYYENHWCYCTIVFVLIFILDIFLPISSIPILFSFQNFINYLCLILVLIQSIRLYLAILRAFFKLHALCLCPHCHLLDIDPNSGGRRYHRLAILTCILVINIFDGIQSGGDALANSGGLDNSMRRWVSGLRK